MTASSDRGGGPTLYKVLDEDRRACHGGLGTWPAPKDGRPGRWVPDLGDDIVPCARGDSCSVDGCDRAARCRGWCAMHYARVKRRGDPGPAGPLRDSSWTPSERFARYVDDSAGPAGCWEWTGGKANGYGNFKVGPGRWEYAHRLAYEAAYGPPLEMQVHHICENRGCVNPAHLEPLSIVDHALHHQAAAAELTHCVNGHPYDEANTYRSPATGRRSCRACHRERERRRRSWQADRLAHYLHPEEET